MEQCPCCGDFLAEGHLCNGASHTAGPWFTGKHGTPDYAPQYGVYADGGKSIAIVTGENAEKDSTLMAQAPKLLEACTTIRNHLWAMDTKDLDTAEIGMLKMLQEILVPFHV
jgi:hypothetical protein